MTIPRDEILRMAHDAGLRPQKAEAGCGCYGVAALERFAALVAAAEREVCEKLANDLYASARADEIASAIRARGSAAIGEKVK